MDELSLENARLKRALEEAEYAIMLDKAELSKLRRWIGAMEEELENAKLHEADALQRLRAQEKLLLGERRRGQLLQRILHETAGRQELA